MGIMQNFRAGAALVLEVKRKDGGKTDNVDVFLGQFPDEIPAELPKESSSGKALVAPKPVDAAPGDPIPKKADAKKDDAKKEDAKKDEKKEEAKKDDKEKEKPKTGLQKIEGVGAAQRKFWVYVPENYDPNISHGLIVWLHPAERGGGRDADDMIKIWDIFCEDHNFIMIGPTAGQPTGWVAGEVEGVMEDLPLGADALHDRRQAHHRPRPGRRRPNGLLPGDQQARGDPRRGARWRGAGVQPEGTGRQPACRVPGDRGWQGPAGQGDRRSAEEAGREEVQGPLPRNANYG